MLPFRVLELAGPATAVCGRLLAEAGADVIKLDAPQRIGEQDSPAALQPWRLFHDTGKRAMTLDIRQPRGAELFRKLTARIDVVIEDFRPGELASLGLDFPVLNEINPGLVLVSITAFGQDGPYSHFAANDLVVFAMGGVMFISGEPGRPPVVAPDQQAYVTGGTHAALGALAALWNRSQGGQGDWVDVSMFECLVAQENTITNFLRPGEFARRNGSQHRTSLPGRIFRSRDGWVHVFITREEPVWQRFLEWIGNPPELADQSLGDINARWEQYDLVDGLTERFVSERAQEELFVSAQANHLPCVPVNRLDEFLADPQTVQNQPVVEIEQPGAGSYRTLRPPFAAHGGLRHAPYPGEHNEELYAELFSFDASAVQKLLEEGIV